MGVDDNNLGEQKQKVSADTKKKYDEYYRDGESEWRAITAESKANHIINLCSDVTHDHIIDVGAGEGSVTELLSNKEFGKEIVCAEISESGIKTIKNRNIKNVKSIVEFDGYNLPCSDSEFDLAIATHVLEHVEFQREFLQELARVSDYVYIEVPLLDTFRLESDFNENKVGHINFYNYKTFRRLVQTVNYTVIDQQVFSHSLKSFRYKSNYIKGLIKYLIYKCGEKLNPELASKLLVYHCGVICRV